MLIRGADGRLYELTPAGLKVHSEAAIAEQERQEGEESPDLLLTAGADFVNPRFP